MRVVNDKEEKTAPSELGFLAIAAHAFLTALGIATVIFGPLPMVLSHIKLEDPWPKVTALIGAVIALTFLEVPPAFVLVTFIFGLFVADTVAREVGLWELLLLSLAVALILGVGVVGVLAQLDKTSLLSYWSSLVDVVIKQVQASVSVDKSFRWDMMRAIFLYEGPFLYLSGAILSVWFSIGLAAHLEWFPDGHVFSGERLRELRLPWFVSVGFVLLFVGAFSGAPKWEHWFGGFFRLASCVMFIQGCVFLSQLLSRRALSSWARTAVYSVAILLGFYALMGVGVVSPWLYRKRERLEEAL